MSNLNLGALMKKFRLSKILILAILIDAFLWYYLTLKVIAVVSSIFNVQQVELLLLHSLGALLGEIIGLFPKNRYKTLLLWVILGTTTAPLPFLVPTLLNFQSICFVWGFSFGFGIPASLAYFTENTSIEYRGRLSGIVLSTSFFCAAPLAGLAFLFGLQVLYTVFTVCRAIGFIPLFFLRNTFEKLKFDEDEETEKYVILNMQGKLHLYFIPWLIFNLVDAFEGMLLTKFLKTTFSEHFALLQITFLVLLGTFAFFGGFLCDAIGRKPVIILGFTAIGMAYAIISVIPHSLAAWFLFAICNGFSWGLFYTIFVFLIWGDIAPKGFERKYYFIGTSPIFMATFAQTFFAGYILLLSETSAFSLAAIFLFLAVLPILFAPETLPEKTLKERELRSYIEKAKRVREKFTKG
jgi:MFS family permease